MPVLTSSAPTSPVEVDSFEAWRERMSNRFVRLHVSTTRPDDFHGRIQGRRFDDVNLSRISASVHQVDRLPKDIRSDENRYYKLSLILSGSGLIVQNGQQATLGSGDMALYDTGQPYSATFADHTDSIVMVFPREAMSVPRDDVDNLLAHALRPSQPGLIRVASSFLEQVGTALGTVSGHTGILLAHNALDVMNTVLYAELGLDSIASPRASAVAAIKDYIEHQLADPSLSPSTVAAAHFMSTRRLQYLFEEAGTTVSSWIRQRRLEHARRDLLDPSLADLSLIQISSRWGLADAPHFSRSFKSAFGEAPSEYRRTAEQNGDRERSS